MISADQKHERWARWNTRMLDLAFVAVSAILWVPLLVTVSLLVVLTSGRPVLFRQHRVGLGGELFPMLKFRSMTNGENPLVPDPARITRIGRLLRRSSFDELPQLINVVRGQMSLVGPRPMLPAQVAALSELERSRHTVRPGLTGLAQVSGRNSLLWEERFTLDLRWAFSPRLRTYLHILARTVRVVAGGEGVGGHDSADPFVNLSDDAQQPVVVRLIDFDIAAFEAENVLRTNERGAA